MGTANFYLEQAKLLFLLAAADSDPVIKELLHRRAQEYLHLADELYTESKLIVTLLHTKRNTAENHANKALSSGNRVHILATAGPLCAGRGS